MVLVLMCVELLHIGEDALVKLILMMVPVYCYHVFIYCL